MKPWDIIGWLLLFVAGTVVLAGILGWVIKYVEHLLTRNTPPAIGQRWYQGADILSITSVSDTLIGIQCIPATWSDTRAEWRQRVRQRRLRLVR